MSRKILTGIVCCILLMNVSIVAQDLIIKKTNDPIKIDGMMNEAAWQDAQVADQFHQYFPTDSVPAVMETEVRVLYDEQNIYVFAILRSPYPRDHYVTPSFRRDYVGRAFDGFTVVLDTYQDKTNAFNFGLNPFGVQREGLVSNGGSTSGSGGGGSSNSSFSTTWDNKWFSASIINEDHWVAEMAIPFKTIRFKENIDTWFVNFYRIDSENGEVSSWAPIPQNLSIIDLGFNRPIQFEEPLQSPGKNISIIPFTAFSTSTNFEEKTPTENQFSLGGDAKIALSSAMNLDLTVNPDFSQVEVDQQVTNLDRFEIFFPERRQFFLENADLFASFGSSRARPFFSRRIGIAQDTATGTNLQNPLYFGARASGKINNDWRIGAMTVQTAEEKAISLSSINYSVASIQRKIWNRSNIAAIFVNKQAFQDSLDAPFTLQPNQWNRTFGLDFNYAASDSKWSGKAYYHRTWNQERLDSTYSAGLEAESNTYRWDFRGGLRTVGANFNPEVGFVSRTDYTQNLATLSYKFYPRGGAIQTHGPGLDYDILGNQQYGTTDWDANILYNIAFRNTARFNLRLRRQFTYLFDPFDPSGTEGPELAANTKYWYNFVIASYSSDQRKSFFYDLSTSSGQYYNGSRINLEGSMTYRFQPYGFVSLNFEYNRIKLPEPYHDANLYLIGPKIDITFSKNIFWTTFIQYNSQINNMNINTRFQWRYAPVSDLFIVYTDNYYTDITDSFIDFNSPKTRALVMKLTYWLNL
ncbi:MAG: DUF5916 domain-containing protein [Saprospiraceae bacterium]